MASDDSCYKLVIGDLPDEMVDDELLISLFFESSSLCPDGGDVDDVKMHPNCRKAVVTFADSEVVNRLLKCKTVSFKGALLSIQSFKTEQVSDQESSSDADDGDDNGNDVGDDDDDNKGGSRENHDSKEEAESNGEEDVDCCDDETGSVKDKETSDVSNTEKAVGEHHNLSNDENFSEMNIDSDDSHSPSRAVEPVKDVSSDEYCSLGEDDVASDTQHTETKTEITEVRTESSAKLPESLINLSHSNDNSENLSETDDEEKNGNMPDCLQTSVDAKTETLLPGKKPEDLAVVSKVISQENTVTPTEMHKDEVKLSSEKVKLLRILSEAEILSDSLAQSVTNFDAENGRIILEGTMDNILNTKLALLEKASDMSNFRVEMRKQTSHLLFTVQGAQWLEKEFQQHQIHAVLYQKDKDNSVGIVASDDMNYEKATKALQEILSVKVIPFQDDHLEYLKSDACKKSIEEFSAKELIHISVDCKSSEITVEGHADSMRLICDNILALLKTNSKVTESIILRKGSLRLMKEHCNAVGKTVKDVLKNLDHLEVVIEYKDDCIELTGTRKAVEEANRVITDEYLSSIQHVQYDVTMPGVTVESFTTKDSFGEEIIESLEMKHKCVVEVREHDPKKVDETIVSTDTHPDGKAAADALEATGILDNVKAAVSSIVTPILSGMASVFDQTPTNINVPKIASNITVQCGSLVDFQADVLVNPIAHTTRRLVKAGAVSKSFYDKGKDLLQQEFEQVGSPNEFGGAISVTSNTAGAFPCKKIYHVAIRHFRNSRSNELMRKMIEGCLKKAEGENMTSVAFPTVGCGKLGYNTMDVVRCFNEAACNSTLQVYIIGYEQATCDAFTSYLTQPILNKPQETVQQKLEVAKPKPAPLPKPPTLTSTALSSVRKGIVFHIVALNKQTADKAREYLARKLSECLADTKVEKELIANLSDEMINTIKKIPSASNIDLKIDKESKTIQLRGHHVSVRETKARIDQLLAEEEKHWKDLKYVKQLKGVAAYLSKLAKTEDLQLPKYWKHYKQYDQQDAGSIETKLEPDTEVYKAVEAMVMGTWDAGKVGHGNDAANLSHSSIKIEKIFVIENLHLFHCYKSQLKNLSYRASNQLFKSVTSLQGEVEIATKSPSGVNYLYDDLVSEINEYYLLHGTSNHKIIVKAGIDSRFSGDKVLFGKGAYFAEKSIKADQYADPKDKRKANGEKLYMFVARVLLGEPHLCQKPYSYKKAPCADATCQSDSCQSNHRPCDSVIGTHKIGTGGAVRLLFREFIVYQVDQSYPEFLVEYVRQ